MLGTAQTDALGAKGAGYLGIIGLVRIGPYNDALVLKAGTYRGFPDFIGPAQKAGQVLGHFGNGKDCLSGIDIPGGSVNGDHSHPPCTSSLPRKTLSGDYDILTAGDTGGAHTPGDNRRVGGHSAGGGKNALCGMHTADILRTGLFPDQQYLLPDGDPAFRLLSGKTTWQLAVAAPGEAFSPVAISSHYLFLLRIDIGMKELVELCRAYPAYRRLLVNEAFSSTMSTAHFTAAAPVLLAFLV